MISRLDPHVCPKCGSRELASVEKMTVLHDLTIQADGAWDYAGYSKDLYEECDNVSTSADRLTVWCGECLVEFEVAVVNEEGGPS